MLTNGAFGRAAVPSGASTGTAEAFELRDGVNERFGGSDVTRAVANVDELGRAIHALDARDQQEIDGILRTTDGTENLSRLGANAVLGVSLAVSRAAADSRDVPLYTYIAELARAIGIRTEPALPVPMVNIFSGGLHAGHGMDVQDFLVISLRADDYLNALEILWRVRQAATEVLRGRGTTTLLADEGGLSPGFSSADEAFEALVEAIDLAGFEPGRDVCIAVDVAANGLWNPTNGTYDFARAQRRLTPDKVIGLIEAWTNTYPIVSIEDPLHDESWPEWSRLTSRLGEIQIVGDDLFVTNATRIRRGALSSAANCALIKVNQNGTLTGTLEAMNVAHAAGFGTIVSARSGETEDAFIADLAVGTGCGQIKIGSLRTSDRLSKYNQLARISEQTSPLFAPEPLRRLRAAASKRLAT